MNYWVIAADGNKYGPADLTVLNEWAQQNRLTPDSELEAVGTGERIRARDIPGLMLPLAQPQQPVQPQNPVAQNPYTPQAPTGQATYNPHDPLSQPQGQPHQPQPQGQPGQIYNPYNNPYPRTATHGGDDGSKEITAAYVWAAAGFLFSGCCIPVFCYIPAFISANTAITKGNPGGQTAKTVVIILMVLSLLGGGITFLSVLFPIFTAGF